jgi:tRNA nucleotidyltransferase (CCA-adding enzyme)
MGYVAREIYVAIYWGGYVARETYVEELEDIDIFKLLNIRFRLAQFFAVFSSCFMQRCPRLKEAFR